MKKLLLIIFLTASVLFAQDNNKGRISFVFNGEKIDLAFTSILLQCSDKILISARAEHNDSNVQQMVALEIGFKKLASGDSALARPIIIDINLRNNVNRTGKYLSIRYDKNGLEGGKEENGAATYGAFNNGEKVSWNINSLHLMIGTTSVTYSGKELKITGSFSGTFGSTIAPKGQIAEIKDGKFEIII